MQVLNVFQWIDYKATFANMVTRFWRLRFRIRNFCPTDWMKHLVNEQWRLLKFDCCLLCFVIFYFQKRQYVLRELVRRLHFSGYHILTHILAFVSIPPTTPRTANTWGNILSCFAPLDDRGDRTNQLHWLELLHTSYISLLSQAGKGRVFYSVNKCFETGATFSINKFINLDAMVVCIWTNLQRNGQTMLKY